MEQKTSPPSFRVEIKHSSRQETSVYFSAPFMFSTQEVWRSSSFFIRYLVIISEDSSETLFRALRVLKLFSRDFLFFWRYWGSTKKQTMQKEFNLINRSLKLQQEMMDFPAVHQPCPITGILNYIPQHMFHWVLIYIWSVCVWDVADERVHLERAQVKNLWRRSRGLWRRIHSFTLHHLWERVCTRYAWINSQGS